MGTTLTCLQVYTAKKQHIKVRKSVLENIQYQILRQGYIDIPPQESKYFPDKELFIGPLGDSPWLTIIASSGNLREIAQFLSEIVDITVIFINLIDSDVVHLRRYDHGEIVDEYCNAPHFYDLYGIDPDELSDWNETEEDNLREMTRGDIEKWRDLFVEGVDPDEIRKIWDSDPIFADDILWATTKALGMNDEEIAFNSWADQDQNNFTHLAFQLKNNPAYGSNTKGLPKLTFDGYMEPGQVFVGQQLDLQITVQNNGKPFIGLDIFAWGNALDGEVVHLIKVEALNPFNLEAKKVFDLIPVTDKSQTPKDFLLIGSDATFKFPHDVIDGFESELWGTLPKMLMKMMPGQVKFNIPVSIKNAGSGDLFVAFAPHANPENGRVVYHASFSALPMPRRPLPSKDAILPVSPDLLHNLEIAINPFGLISMGTDRKQSAEIAANIIEAWVAKIKNTDTRSRKFKTWLQADLNLKPKRKYFSVADIATSSDWEQLREGLEDCVMFSIHHTFASIVYDASTLFFQNCDEKRAPHLLFYFAPSELAEKEQNNVNEWLLETINHLMTTTAGLQAMVGRWGWGGTLSGPMHLDATPYEAACNIHGQCTTARFWCQRFLRYVTPHLWLGPDLLSHLSEREKLESVATITAHGEGIRVTLNENATMDEVEAALDPLLPREQDWRDGQGRLYSRKSA